MTDGGRRLRRAVARLGSHQTTRLLAGSVALGLGVALAWLTVLLLVDRFAPLPAVVRAGGLALAVVVPLVVFGRALFRRLPALRDLQEAARRTEAQSQPLKERLVPALQVLDVRDAERTGYSTELVDAFVDETVEMTEGVEPAALPYNVRFRHGAVAAAVGLVLAAGLVAVLGPARTGGGLVRLVGSFGDLGPRPPARFAVDPGDVSVPRGREVTLAARVDHVRIRGGEARAVLQWRPRAGAEWNDVALEGRTVAPVVEVPAAHFAHRFAGVRESFRYRFAHEGETSEEYEVRAVPHPSLTIDEIRYRYPEYTGLPERSVRDGSGDLAAVKGTVAAIRVRCTNEPATARVILDGGSERELALDDDGLLLGELEIVEEDVYRLHVEDKLGLENQNPLTYRIRPLTDEAPFIRVLEPGEDSDLDESLRVALRFSAVDDFGLGPVRLVWEVDRREGEVESAEIFRPGAHVTEIGERWEWNLEPLRLLPGDTVVYHLEVTDNNAVDGPSIARTRDYVLRFPTLGEIYAEIDEGGEASIEDLRDVADEARRIEERIEDISREMLKQGESTWENRKEVERALQQQEQLAEELRQTQEEIEANLDELSQSEFATLEAVEKVEQIRKLLDEVATDEMKEALEKLREALEEANDRQMQEDLAEFQMSQEQMMESLDRIIENLKQFRLEEKLKAAVRQLEELAARQERMNDALEDAPEEAEDEPVGEGEDAEGAEGDESEGEGEDSEGEDSEGEDSEGEDSDGEGEPSEGEQSEGETGSEGEQDLESLAREEEALAEEARRLEQELKELAEMTRELRDSRDQETMDGLSEQMESGQIPQTMDEMSEQMSEGNVPRAKEEGEKALTELQKMLTALEAGQSMMQGRMIQMSQAAINRAVRDLLSVSGDQEFLAGELSGIPRNTDSATRTYADEQHLLIQGTERVDEMLEEVAKDTPFMDSRINKQLDQSVRVMKEAAYGLENGAVHLARDNGEQAVEGLNAVVIQLLETSSSMSSCSSGMPMSGFMQQLQQMTGDQQKLNDALRQLMNQSGSPLDRRLQAELEKLGQEQQRIREQLQQLLDEAGSGEGLLGRLDSVTEALDEVARKLQEGRLDEETIRQQDWALTRLLDSQRSMRERDFGRERKSETAEDLAELLPPGALPEGLEDEERDLREDLLKALDRRYPPKYEELIRRYFRSLSDEGTTPDLP